MYPCTRCGLPLSGPLCPRCGQTHSAPGLPDFQHTSSRAPNMLPGDVPAAGPAMIPGQAVGPRQAPPPQSAAGAARTSGPGAGVIIGVLSTVVLVGLVALAWFFLFGGRDAATTEPAPTPPVAITTPEPSSESLPSVTVAPETPVVTQVVTVDVQEAARAQLEQVRADDMANITLDGRWVAVLSTKKSGTTDPGQTAKNGSHTFYEDDILALHDDLAAYFWEDANVLLVKSSDFGRQPTSGEVFWRSIADRAFTSKDDVAAWCAQHYSGTAEEIENSCLPRELLPPTRS